MTTAVASMTTVDITKSSRHPRATFGSRRPEVMPRRRHSSRQSFQALSPAGPFRLRSHSKRLSRDLLLYERKVVLAREQQGTNWRHGSPAESGLSRACRPSPRGGRQTRKRAVSVKVSADGPRLLALAVPVNQRTVPGGPGGDFYGRRAHGRARCRADGIPGPGKGLKNICLHVRASSALSHMCSGPGTCLTASAALHT